MLLSIKKSTLQLGSGLVVVLLIATTPLINDKTQLLTKKWRLAEVEFPEIEAELTHFSPMQRKEYKQKLNRMLAGSFIEFRKDYTYIAIILADTAQGTWRLETQLNQLWVKNYKDTAEHAMPILELTKNKLILVVTNHQKMIWQPLYAQK